MSSVHRVSTPGLLSCKSDTTGVDLMGLERMFSRDTSQLLRQLAFLSFSNVKYEVPFFPLYFLVLVPPPPLSPTSGSLLSTVLTMTPLFWRSPVSPRRSCETVELNLCLCFTLEGSGMSLS